MASKDTGNSDVQSDPTTIKDNNVEQDPLIQLQHQEQAKLLKMMEDLRSAQVNEIVKLPQIIVVGDQSSGKSSVLEAISRHKFPTKDGLCTTFATELVLNRSDTYWLKVTIVPGPSRTQSDKERLFRFERYSENAEDLSDFIDAATEEIKQNPIAFQTLSFTDDKLRIEHSGPKCQQPLTLVDLPGLIQAESKKQNRHDIALIKAIVEEYVGASESVILAIIAADNNYVNQQVLKIVQDHDPSGARTLGVITKVDKLRGDPAVENETVQLASNEDRKLQLGWHVLRNRGFLERESSDEERDRAEEEFLSQKPWSNLPARDRGIQALRKKLSDELYKRSVAGLGGIIGSIDSKTKQYEADLSRLGDPRPSKKDKQAFLHGIASKFQELVRAALCGNYRHGFFPDNSDDIDAERLRARVNHLNMNFAQTMRTKGRRWTFVKENAPETRYRREEGDPEPMTIKQLNGLINRIKERNSSRPEVLPNIEMVGHFFRLQSEKWESIARNHIQDVYYGVMTFLDLVLHSINPDDIQPIFSEHIQPIMEAKRLNMEAKLTELLAPYREDDPLTYNERYQRKVTWYQDEWSNSMRKGLDHDSNASDSGFDGNESEPENSDTDYAALEEDFEELDHGCEEILARSMAYYEIARLVFVDNVTILAIEHTLLRGLEEIFSHQTINGLNDEELNRLASEPEDDLAKRADLDAKLRTLREGRRICERHAPRAARPLSTRNERPSMPASYRTSTGTQQLPINRSSASMKTSSGKERASTSADGKSRVRVEDSLDAAELPAAPAPPLLDVPKTKPTRTRNPKVRLPSSPTPIPDNAAKGSKRPSAPRQAPGLAYSYPYGSPSSVSSQEEINTPPTRTGLNSQRKPNGFGGSDFSLGAEIASLMEDEEL